MGSMALTRGERYTIVYRDGGEEKTALAHYRGFGTADAIARGEPWDEPGSAAGGLHWFEIDGKPGYLTVEEDDLIRFEIAEGYGG